MNIDIWSINIIDVDSITLDYTGLEVITKSGTSKISKDLILSILAKNTE